jgi:hydroxyacylglutathione hydrolase
MATVLHARARRDNYIWIVRVGLGDEVIVVDPGDAEPVFEVLAHERLLPAAVLCTHHHDDHVGGAAALAQRYAIPVYGPAAETIPAVTHALREGDTVTLPGANIEFRVWDIPGHTRGHIAYIGAGMVLCGDTLFSAGCGRLFEGTPAQLHRSLARLAGLPATTEVYCGHEYTLANLRFALTVEPNNTDALSYRAEAEQRLAAGKPTLPSTIGREHRVNPFLRLQQPSVRNAIETRAGQVISDDISAFAALRRWKDDFRG